THSCTTTSTAVVRPMGLPSLLCVSMNCLRLNPEVARALAAEPVIIVAPTLSVDGSGVQPHGLAGLPSLLDGSNQVTHQLRERQLATSNRTSVKHFTVRAVWSGHGPGDWQFRLTHGLSNAVRGSWIAGARGRVLASNSYGSPSSGRT